VAVSEAAEHGARRLSRASQRAPCGRDAEVGRVRARGAERARRRGARGRAVGVEAVRWSVGR